jgi:hypothetical protein
LLEQRIGAHGGEDGRVEAMLLNIMVGAGPQFSLGDRHPVLARRTPTHSPSALRSTISEREAPGEEFDAEHQRMNLVKTRPLSPITSEN